MCHVTCVHMCVGVTDNFPLTHPPPLSQAAKSNQSNLPRRLGEDSEVLSPLWPTVPPSLAFVSTRARLSPLPLPNPKQGRLYCFIAFQEDVPTVLTISCRKACSFEKENSRRSGDLGMLLSRWLFRHVSHETLWIWRPHGAGNCPLCLESRQRDETHLLPLALCGVLRKRLWTPAWPWALDPGRGGRARTAALAARAKNRKPSLFAGFALSPPASRAVRAARGRSDRQRRRRGRVRTGRASRDVYGAERSAAVRVQTALGTRWAARGGPRDPPRPPSPRPRVGSQIAEAQAQDDKVKGRVAGVPVHRACAKC